jgi:hypothetical protein
MLILLRPLLLMVAQGLGVGLTLLLQVLKGQGRPAWLKVADHWMLESIRVSNMGITIELDIGGLIVVGARLGYGMPTEYSRPCRVLKE